MMSADFNSNPKADTVDNCRHVQIRTKYRSYKLAIFRQISYLKEAASSITLKLSRKFLKNDH